MERERTGLEIAVVGVGLRVPGARSAAEFWENLAAGRDSVRRFSVEELRAAGVPERLLADPAYVRARGVMGDAEWFDADFFTVSRREAELMDPQHRHFLECAWEAMEDAGYTPETAGRAGVFAGAGMPTYLLRNLYPARHGLAGVSELEMFLGNDKDFLAARAAFRLDLRGPAVGVQAACATSLVAVHLATQSLLAHECDLALAGGVSILVPATGGYLYEEGSTYSPDGKCRAFDARASGLVPADGAAVVALRRLDDALADGDHVRAVILGSAVNNDGAGKAGFTTPRLDGLADAMRAAHAVAGVSARSIGMVEAHGSGTQVGDAIELGALQRVFREDTADQGFCALGSGKSNVGHLSAAAGAAGLVKAVLALEHEAVPPTLHVESPNPAIEAGGPFALATTPRPWPRGPEPRRAAVDSFGMGGTNAYLVLEEAPTRGPRAPLAGPQLLVLSARTPAALERRAAALARHLRANPGLALADVAFTLAVGRRAMPHRRALVAADLADAIRLLESPGDPGGVSAPSAAAGPGGSGEAMLQEAGRLWASGAPVDLAATFRGRGARRVPLPTYPWERRRYWIDAPAEDAAPAVEPAPAAPAAGPVDGGDGEDVVAAVAELWRKLLRADEVRPDDDFFALGGDSLLGVKLIGALRDAFGVGVSAADLWSARTVRRMAALVEERMIDELLASAEAAETVS